MYSTKNGDTGKWTAVVPFGWAVSGNPLRDHNLTGRTSEVSGAWARGYSAMIERASKGAAESYAGITGDYAFPLILCGPLSVVDHQMHDGPSCCDKL
jgi:hypothetical protein